MARPQIVVEGIKEVRRSIDRAERKQVNIQVRKANRSAAEIVADNAKNVTVPVDSGALKASIRALGSVRFGQVAAGRGKTKEYAGVIHFGNPNRNIEPQPFIFEAIENTDRAVELEYLRHLDKIIKSVSTR